MLSKNRTVKEVAYGLTVSSYLSILKYYQWNRIPGLFQEFCKTSTQIKDFPGLILNSRTCGNLSQSRLHETSQRSLSGVAHHTSSRSRGSLPLTHIQRQCTLELHVVSEHGLSDKLLKNTYCEGSRDSSNLAKLSM